MILRLSRRRIVVLLTLMSVVVLMSNAQSNLVFYHSNEQYNSSNFNPAFLTSQKKFTFSIFPIGGNSINLNKEDIFKSLISKPISTSQNNEYFKDIFRNLSDQDLFYLNFESAILNLGYTSDFGSLSFQVKENIKFLLGVRGELTDFLMKPSFQTIPINQTQRFTAEALHYREYSLGYAKDFYNKKFSVGIRAKLFFGKSFLFSEISGAIIEVPDTFYLRIKGPIHLSVPADPQYFDNGYLEDLNIIKNFNSGRYIRNRNNIGVGFDFGIKYKLTPEIAFSASVVDLGGIKWNNNLHTLLFNSKQQFSNQGITKIISENGVPILTKNDDTFLSDSLSFRISIDESNFSKPLPTVFYTGLNYQLNPKLNIGLVDRYINANEINYNSFSLLANCEVNKRFTFITGFSIHENLYKNIPLGIIYKWDSGQSYIGTDNALVFLFPSKSPFMGISFGTCFYLFNNRVKYEEPSDFLPFYKQKKGKSCNKKGLIFSNYSRL